jgi:hypothetical protein
MSEIDPTDPLALLHGLRADVEAMPRAAEARLRQRLASLALAQRASGPPPVAQQTNLRWLAFRKTAVIIAIPASAVLGAFGHAISTRTATTPAPLVRSTPAASTPPAVTAPAAAISELPRESVAPRAPAPARVKARAVAPSSAPAVDSVRAPEPTGGLDADLRLLEQARTELAEGNPGATLQLLRAHELTYPDSPLSQEREALAVKALAGSGSMQEAAGRAEAFVARYPESPLRESVERAVGKKP